MLATEQKRHTGSDTLFWESCPDVMAMLLSRYEKNGFLCRDPVWTGAALEKGLARARRAGIRVPEGTLAAAYASQSRCWLLMGADRLQLGETVIPYHHLRVGASALYSWEDHTGAPAPVCTVSLPDRHRALLLELEAACQRYGPPEGHPFQDADADPEERHSLIRVICLAAGSTGLVSGYVLQRLRELCGSLGVSGSFAVTQLRSAAELTQAETAEKLRESCSSILPLRHLGVFWECASLLPFDAKSGCPAPLRVLAALADPEQEERLLTQVQLLQPQLRMLRQLGTFPDLSGDGREILCRTVYAQYLAAAAAVKGEIEHDKFQNR